MQVLTLDASTDPTDVIRGPLSGEGSMSVSATVIAGGLQLQGSSDQTTWYDLTDVTVTADGGSVNFKTDFRYLRAKPITGAVTAERIEISGLGL